MRLNAPNMNMLIDKTPVSLLAAFKPQLDPMARLFALDLPKPTLKDPAGDIDRVLAAVRREGASSGLANEFLQVPLDLVRRISRILRDTSFRVTAVVAKHDNGYELIDVRDSLPHTCFGIAIDVGTTIVSIYLVDLQAEEIVAKAVVENPQIAHGEDVLSRIHFCQTQNGLQKLRELIISCINETIHEIAGAADLRPNDIYAATVAGNPAMMHFFVGADPYSLCREPYVTAFNLPLQYRASELRISIFPHAPVYLFPNFGSYFGGDVVAGILASGIYQNEVPSLLVDVGTNAEIVIGNRDWVVACAGAAGPALESGGAKTGMRAIGGAIENVRIDPHTLEPAYEVIGGGPARGICGSGLIDLVAQLYLANVLDSSGRISDSRRSLRICGNGEARGYALAFADRGESARDIIVDELDIRNLLRAKGAMFTALSLVTERLGIGFSELETFFVAGSFGEHIDPRHAVTIGMLPDIPLEKFRVLGNSAGLGACLLLISSPLRRVVEDIRRKATYIQLTTDNEFMRLLGAALFIPHTQKELFPSVRR